MLNSLALCFFVIGSFLHTLAQIDAIARAKNNPATSRLELLRGRWSTILIRDAWCLAFFVLWLQGQLAGFLRAVGVPLPHAADALLDLHVGSAIGFMAGYCFDSLLGFVPKLRTAIPPSIYANDGEPKPPTTNSSPDLVVESQRRKE